jgi:hypothetical protein
MHGIDGASNGHNACNDDGDRDEDVDLADARGITLLHCMPLFSACAWPENPCLTLVRSRVA